MPDLMLPTVATIVRQRDETPDVRTYALRYRDADEQARFSYRPGQFVELSVFGAGEAPFCLASSPTRTDGIDVTVRRVGRVTDALFALAPGDEIGLRGPCGNGFDVEAARGHDLVFVAGGIGLPPLRSLIWNALDRRAEFGDITILYGARTPADLVYKDELREWSEAERVTVRVTVDRGAS
ncbi:MAG: FAD/NAD(P)-binding protein, partial [Gemmatimonadaceae bacterium]|nr:FAD/NAD(P)-binding protein [Gemmatimonadaceae bacterium]